MFDKVLIANRGEVAVRIARSCERLGIATVAIHSDIEAEAAHVKLCDEAVAVGGAPVGESYLNVEAIIEAAKSTGAQAIHPGYGLLSERPDFARAVQAAELVFIGPSPEAMETFGDKVRARELAHRAGVRVLPGTASAFEDPALAGEAAQQLGFPLMVKAAGGGGGIGMQRVDDWEGLEGAATTCAERARAAFGDGRVFLERFVDRPRHLEVQVVADREGTYAALGERECSVQRRHQKLLEEAPSPMLASVGRGDLRREILCDSALRIAKEAGYEGVGTAEFLVDAEGGFHFVEFNPRLQVEHGVTEMCTGIDLVETQLRVAAGEPLSEDVTTAEPRGHAMQARIYAEDPREDFQPRPGKIETFRWPTVAPGALRVETGVAPGDAMTPHYDPLVALMISFTRARHLTLLNLDRVLAETEIAPLTTNVQFLRQVLADEAFRAGQYDVTLTQQLLDAAAAEAEAAAAAAAKKDGAKSKRPPRR